MTRGNRSWRRLYPFESRFLERGGLRQHYLDEGAGEPIVMLHGNPTWSFYYRQLVMALRADYRCVVPDHIGCGLSDKPGDEAYDYCLERRVDDLVALLDHLDLRDPITLVLHDWGGMIGMAWAQRRPERIKRLVILNTAAFLMPQAIAPASNVAPASTVAPVSNRSGRPTKSLPLRLRLLHGRNPLTSLAVRGLNLFSWAAAHMATTKRLSRDVRAGLMAPYNSWNNRIATLRFVQDIPLRPGDRSYDLAKSVDDHLHVFRDLPMLICWGRRDFVFDDSFLDEWRRRFPAAEVHTFTDAGHYVLEDVADEIVPLIQSFLLRNHLENRMGVAEEV